MIFKNFNENHTHINNYNHYTTINKYNESCKVAQNVSNVAFKPKYFEKFAPLNNEQNQNQAEFTENQNFT